MNNVAVLDAYAPALGRAADRLAAQLDAASLKHWAAAPAARTYLVVGDLVPKDVELARGIDMAFATAGP